MVTLSHTLRTWLASGRSKLRRERKSACTSNIFKLKKLAIVEQITYYCMMVKITMLDWLDDIAWRSPCHSRHLPIIFTWNLCRMCHWSLEDFLQTTFHCQPQVLEVFHIFLIFISSNIHFLLLQHKRR